jgi:putative lipoic acid-binding regulatory protein
MGSAGPALYQHILRVMDIHAPGYAESDISIKNSNKGNWQSITVVITATGKPQLDALFADLKTSTEVKMVL